MLKKCPDCGEIKDLTEYYKDKRTKNGYQCYCKKCQSENFAKWRINNRKRNNELSRQWYHNNKSKAIEMIKKYEIKNREKIKNYRDQYSKKYSLENCIMIDKINYNLKTCDNNIKQIIKMFLESRNFKRAIAGS